MARVKADRCYVYGGVVDLRKGANTLRVLVGGAQSHVPYLFSNRTRALLKFPSVEEPEVWCGARRLHHSYFDWPEMSGGSTEAHTRGARLAAT